MRVLYIDPASFLAHSNYNRMQIEALCKIADRVDFVFKEGYEKDLNIASDNIVYSIPLRYYKRTKNSLLSRLITIYVYYLIKRNIKLNDYDVILFSYYDEICLFFVKYPLFTYLINHINVSGLPFSRIKRFFYRCVSQRYKQIVLDAEVYLHSLGVDNVEVVAHGLVKPFYNKSATSVYDQKFKGYSKIIFSPSLTSVDEHVLAFLIADSAFLDYLASNNVLFVLRSQVLKSTCGYIHIIRDVMEKEDYECLFLKSDVIFLPYPRSFQYRTSGVLLEALSNHKKALVSDTSYFRQYQNVGIDIRYFTSNSDVLSSLQTLLSLSSSEVSQSVNDLLALMPDYKFLLNKHDV